MTHAALVGVRQSISLAACALLMSCATWWADSPPQTIPVHDIINQIKYEIALFQTAQPSDFRSASDVSEDPPCPGEIDLAIQSVRVSLATLNTNSASAEAGAEVPIGPVRLGPSFSRSREHINSQTLTFHVYLEPGAPAPDPNQISHSDIWEGTPIATALTDLRRSLEQADHDRPCLTLENLSPQAPANTFTFGFVIVETEKGSGKLKFLVFSIGSGEATQRRVENTITVTFRGSGWALE